MKRLLTLLLITLGLCTGCVYQEGEGTDRVIVTDPPAADVNIDIGSGE